MTSEHSVMAEKMFQFALRLKREAELLCIEMDLDSSLVNVDITYRLATPEYIVVKFKSMTRDCHSSMGHRSHMYTYRNEKVWCPGRDAIVMKPKEG